MNSTEIAALKQHDKGDTYRTAATRIGVAVADLVNASLGRDASDLARRAYNEERGTFPTIPSDAWPYRCGGCNVALDKADKRACTRCGGVVCHACGTVHPACKVIAEHERSERQREAFAASAAITAALGAEDAGT